MGDGERRSVVVTGAAGGIGKAIAATFRDEGDEVVVLDLVSPDEPLDGVRYVAADIADADAVEAAFAEIERVDVLVNNAGINRAGIVGQQSRDEFGSVISTNLIGAFHCTSQAVGRMASGGSIVSISSTNAIVGLPGRGAYAASKAALLALTRVWAVELAPREIRVNAVCPGFVRTPLVERALDDGSLQLDWMMRRVPAARLAEPQEIARVVRFLASGDASFVTGEAIVADGGWTVQGIDERPQWLA